MFLSHCALHSLFSLISSFIRATYKGKQFLSLKQRPTAASKERDRSLLKVLLFEFLTKSLKVSSTVLGTVTGLTSQQINSTFNAQRYQPVQAFILGTISMSICTHHVHEHRLKVTFLLASQVPIPFTDALILHKNSSSRSPKYLSMVFLVKFTNLISSSCFI